jgi:predicted ATPase
MMTSFGIQHFKCFENIELPLTYCNILTGKNGMGKSSVIQALLLLRQSEGSRGLCLQGSYLQLAPAKKILYEATPKDDEVIRFTIDESHDKSQSSKGHRTEYEFEFSPSLAVLPMIKRADVERSYNSELDIFAKQLYYLSANRILPKKSYPNGGGNTSRSKNIGIEGEYTAQLLSEYGNRQVKHPNLYHSYYTATPKESSTLLQEASTWLSEMTTEVRVRVTDHNNEFQLQYEYASEHGYTTPFDPMNVGFGLTYCLPVIVACLLAEPDSILIIENPEAHLHPKGQSKLGELLARMAQNGVQCFVETHSDHLLNGVRIAVMQGMLDADKANVFFFERENQTGQQKSIVHTVDILPDGRLSAEYEDFFDQIERDYDTLLGI